MVNNLLVIQETWIRTLAWEDPLEKEWLLLKGAAGEDS